jgi:hypothetical protein
MPGGIVSSQQAPSHGTPRLMSICHCRVQHRCPRVRNCATCTHQRAAPSEHRRKIFSHGYPTINHPRNGFFVSQSAYFSAQRLNQFAIRASYALRRRHV